MKRWVYATFFFFAFLAFLEVSGLSLGVLGTWDLEGMLSSSQSILSHPSASMISVQWREISLDGDWGITIVELVLESTNSALLYWCLGAIVEIERVVVESVVDSANLPLNHANSTKSNLCCVLSFKVTSLIVYANCCNEECSIRDKLISVEVVVLEEVSPLRRTYTEAEFPSMRLSWPDKVPQDPSEIIRAMNEYMKGQAVMNTISTNSIPLKRLKPFNPPGQHALFLS